MNESVTYNNLSNLQFIIVRATTIGSASIMSCLPRYANRKHMLKLYQERVLWLRTPTSQTPGSSQVTSRQSRESISVRCATVQSAVSLSITYIPSPTFRSTISSCAAAYTQPITQSNTFVPSFG